MKLFRDRWILKFSSLRASVIWQIDQLALTASRNIKWSHILPPSFLPISFHHLTPTTFSFLPSFWYPSITWLLPPFPSFLPSDILPSLDSYHLFLPSFLPSDVLPSLDSYHLFLPSFLPSDILPSLDSYHLYQYCLPYLLLSRAPLPLSLFKSFTINLSISTSVFLLQFFPVYITLYFSLSLCPSVCI